MARRGAKFLAYKQQRPRCGIDPTPDRAMFACSYDVLTLAGQRSLSMGVISVTGEKARSPGARSVSAKQPFEIAHRAKFHRNSPLVLVRTHVDRRPVDARVPEQIRTRRHD